LQQTRRRNRLGGNLNDMMLFNDVIHHLDLVEIPLKGRALTWSNMQQNCLLEKIDWVFTSSDWTLAFPNTLAFALSNVVSDHVPYVISMESAVPKATNFRFENYWASFSDFLPTVEHFWSLAIHSNEPALIISTKFKVLRRGLRAWSKELSKLNKLINNCSYVLGILDGLEEQRSLPTLEINFRKQLKLHLLNLLEAKRSY
jgi:hypothetical protein